MQTQSQPAAVLDYFNITETMTYEEMRAIRGVKDIQIEQDDDDSAPYALVYVETYDKDAKLRLFFDYDEESNTYLLHDYDDCCEWEIDYDLMTKILWDAKKVDEHSPYKTLIILSLTKDAKTIFPSQEIRQIDRLAEEMAEKGGYHQTKIQGVLVKGNMRLHDDDPYKIIYENNWQFDN